MKHRYCRNCRFIDDPSHYRCQECVNGNNHEKPVYCKHDNIKTECEICYRMNVQRLEKRENARSPRPGQTFLF